MRQRNFGKVFFVIVVLLCVYSMPAGAQSFRDGFAVYQSLERYKCFYNMTDQQAVNFTVTVNGRNLYIGSQTYSLRRLGTITSQGVEFKSYEFSTSGRMFCVSTSQISVQVSTFNTKTGYVLLIDDKTYFATRLSN